MPVGAAIGAAGAIGSAGINAFAANSASNKQVAFGKSALAQQMALFQQALGLTQPFIDAGKSAATTLSGLLTPGPNQTSILSSLPGFQFAQDWGQKAVANLGSTLGFGGNTLKAGADFATGTAQQGFSTLAELLQNLASMGAGSANALISGSVGQGGVIGNTLTGIGSSSAAGTLGVGNALAGGLSGSTNSITNALLLNKLLSNSTPNANILGNGIYSNPELAGIQAQTASL